MNIRVSRYFSLNLFQFRDAIFFLLQLSQNSPTNESTLLHADVSDMQVFERTCDLKSDVRYIVESSRVAKCEPRQRLRRYESRRRYSLSTFRSPAGAFPARAAVVVPLSGLSDYPHLLTHSDTHSQVHLKNVFNRLFTRRG